MSWRQEAEKTASSNAANNPRWARANNLDGRFFSAGDATEVSPRRHLKASTQFFAPEADRTVAGGGAQRNHRKRHRRGLRALEGRRTNIDSAANPGPASLPGREIGFGEFRWLRCAPPPANV